MNDCLAHLAEGFRTKAAPAWARRGAYDRVGWAEIISSTLEARGRCPAQLLRNICDPYSRGAKPSLRP